MPNNLTDSEEDRLLDLSLLDGDLLALVTALGTDSAGGIEVVGGSYAKQPLSYNPAAGGVKTSAADVTFDAMPGVDVRGWEIYDSTGTTRRWYGLINQVSGTAQAAADTITAAGHGMANDTKIVFRPGFAPAGITAGDTYYVRDSATNTFKVAATLGGAVVDITADAAVVEVGKVVTIDAGDGFVVNAGNVTLSLS